MSEIDPLNSIVREQSDWDDHYNTPEGRNNVAIRQALYWNLAPGQVPPDYELEIISALQHAGVPNTASLLDIGCS